MTTMKSLLHSLCLLVFAAGIVSAQDLNLNTCEEGWLHFSGSCYLIRDEYKAYDHAAATCSLFGADLFYAKDKESMQYIKHLIGSKTVYGWWYGQSKWSIDLKGLPMFKTAPMSPPASGCVGWRLGDTYDIPMVSTPCNIHLPFICRGDPATVDVTALPPGDWFNLTSGIYLATKVTEQRPFEEAESFCKEHTMELLYIKDMAEMAPLLMELTPRTNGHATPWWIGLKADHGNFSWTSGYPLIHDLLRWTRYEYFANMLLLSDGTLDPISNGMKARFICMRPQLAVSKSFGCPYSWTRGGQSCYKHVDRYYSWNKTQSLCEKLDSHLISVDSDIELTYLRNSELLNSYSDTWTSLTDQGNDDHELRWADGSEPLDSVVKWQLPVHFGEEKCVALYFYTEPYTLEPTRCESYNHLPGCQYALNANESCASPNWSYYKGKCYYTYSNNDDSYFTPAGPYNTMLQKCSQDLEKYSNSSNVIVTQLKLDDPGIVDVYKKKAYWSVMTGLKILPDGRLKWPDNTYANSSILRQEERPHSGDRCVVVNIEGRFREVSCSDSYMMVCEKEVPYSATNPSNAGNTPRTQSWAMLLITCVNVFAVCRIFH